MVIPGKQHGETYICSSQIQFVKQRSRIMVSLTSSPSIGGEDTISNEILTSDPKMAYDEVYDNTEHRHFDDVITNHCLLHELKWISNMHPIAERKIEYWKWVWK